MPSSSASKRDPERHPDARGLGRAADEVRGEPQRRLLDELDDRDHVGRGEARDPGLVVDGEGVQARAPGDGAHRELRREAAGAARSGRVDVEVARRAVAETQLPGGAAPPEVLVLRRHLREQAEGGGGRSAQADAPVRVRSRMRAEVSTRCSRVAPKARSSGWYAARRSRMAARAAAAA